MLVKENQDYILNNYNDYFVRDFPEDELKPLEILLKDLDDNAEILRFCDSENDYGYAYCYSGDSYCLIDYLAIHPEFKRKGQGKKLIKELKEYYDFKKIIFLETDDLDNEISKNRLKFYMASGVIISNIRLNLFEVDYLIGFVKNSIDDKDIKNELINIYKLLYKNYFKDKVIFK